MHTCTVYIVYMFHFQCCMVIMRPVLASGMCCNFFLKSNKGNYGTSSPAKFWWKSDQDKGIVIKFFLIKITCNSVHVHLPSIQVYCISTTKLIYMYCTCILTFLQEIFCYTCTKVNPNIMDEQQNKIKQSNMNSYNKFTLLTISWLQ